MGVKKMELTYGPSAYAEVKINGKQRIIEVLSNKNGIIKGYRANKDGSRWDKDDGIIWSQEIIIVSSDSILRYLKLDLVYGELVEDK